MYVDDDDVGVVVVEEEDWPYVWKYNDVTVYIYIDPTFIVGGTHGSCLRTLRRPLNAPPTDLSGTEWVALRADAKHYPWQKMQKTR